MTTEEGRGINLEVPGGAAGTVPVRDATSADVELLVTMRLEYIRADLGAVTPADGAALAGRVRAWLAAELGRRCFAVLADADGHPAAVGLLVVGEFPPNPGMPTGRVGTVLNVWTREGFRRRGLARAVLERLVALGRERRLDRLELRSSAMARPLYASLGFQDAPADHTPMRLRL